MRMMAALGGLGALLLAACATEPGRESRALQPRADWSADLSGLLPGIKACLDSVEDQTVAITKAWPIGSDLTGARMLKADGNRVDCVAVANGAGVILTEPVLPASRLAGERDPLFTPVAEASPPSNPCFSTNAVRDDDGTQLGWVSYDVCRDPRPITRVEDVQSAPRNPPRFEEG